MPTKITFSAMTRESLRFLSENTNITYFGPGSVAKALVEATNLQISKLQDYISSAQDNSFLTTAGGIYLDLFGEMLGVQRISDRKASSSISDGSVRFYVDSGTLGSRLPDPSNPGKGLIPKGTTVSTSTGKVLFTVTTDTNFPINSKSAYVPVESKSSGSSYNVGANQLTTHSLGVTSVKVTNDIAISSGADVETDAEYRFRLAKAMTAKFGSNSTAIKIAASSQAGVSRVELLPYARGSGTFDVLVVPQGNRLQDSVKQNVRRAVESVTAYGISPRIVEPDYVRICLAIQLKFSPGTSEGSKIAARSAAEGSILRYLGNIAMGGELVINQLRAVIINSDPNIKDFKIIELCVNGTPRIITNVQLAPNELIVPDEQSPDSIRVI